MAEAVMVVDLGVVNVAEAMSVGVTAEAVTVEAVMSEAVMTVEKAVRAKSSAAEVTAVAAPPLS